MGRGAYLSGLGMENDGIGNECLREGEVAEQHLDKEDYGEGDYLLRDLSVELKQPPACNASRAIGQPSRECRYAGLPVTSVCSSLGRSGLRWWYSGTKANHVERVAGEAQETRDEYEEDVCDDQL
jgi:hypothetical protein